MKKHLLPFLCFLLVGSAFSQSPVDVTEQTIKIGGYKTEELYFGFAAGDQVLFSFNEAENKELKELEVVEWPSSSRFSEYKTSKVENRVFRIAEKAVLKFRFYNGSLSGRICKIKVQRIPANEAMRTFNTNVNWREVYDTTWIKVNEHYLVKKSYVPKAVVPLTEFYVNSGSNALFLSGKSRVSFPVPLPRNTVEWYYKFSATRNKEDIEQTSQRFNLLGELTNLIDRTGGISFGVDALTKPPGADYCDVYLLDFENSQLFEAKSTFHHYSAGSRENLKSGVVKMPGGAGMTYVVGIKNPDNAHGVNVAIECVAVVLEEEWSTREVQKPVVSNRVVPFFGN